MYNPDFICESPDMDDPLSRIITLLRPRTVLSKPISGAGRWGVRYTEFGEPSFCTPLEVCGNGIIDSDEQCDDGGNVPGDGCDDLCIIEPGYQCEGVPSMCTLIIVCGDGLIQVGEGCDDGNITFGDGCSGTCSVEAGYNCMAQYIARTITVGLFAKPPKKAPEPEKGK